MKNALKKIGLAAVALMLAVAPAMADTYDSFGDWNGAVGGPVTTVNFGGVPLGPAGWTAVSSGTTISGITFSTNLGSQISVANSTFSGLYGVGANSQALTASLCTACGGDYLEINFNQSVSAFGMNMNVFTVPFIIKLSNGQTFTIIEGGRDIFFGEGNLGSFTWARVYSPFPIIGSISYVADSTQTAAVPEPASLILLGSGLLGGAAGMKRRFKKA